MEQKRRTSLLSLWATDKPVAVAVCHAMRDGQDHKDSKVNSGVQHLDSKIQASSQDSVTTLPRFGLQGLLSEGFVDFGCLLSGLRKERVHLHVSFPHARVRFSFALPDGEGYFWSTAGDNVDRHHVSLRKRLYATREESFPIPLM